MNAGFAEVVAGASARRHDELPTVETRAVADGPPTACEVQKKPDEEAALVTIKRRLPAGASLADIDVVDAAHRGAEDAPEPADRRR